MTEPAINKTISLDPPTESYSNGTFVNGVGRPDPKPGPSQEPPTTEQLNSVTALQARAAARIRKATP